MSKFEHQGEAAVTHHYYFKKSTLKPAVIQAWIWELFHTKSASLDSFLTDFKVVCRCNSIEYLPAALLTMIFFVRYMISSTF